jgi:soluble lytic murein transglycosylase-like protein
MVSLRLAVIAWSLLAGSSQALDWSRAGGGLLIGQDAGAICSCLAAEPSWPTPSTPRQPYADKVEAAAGRHGLDPKLLHALVIVESGYRPEAVSHAGATGLTQLMPGTAAELGVTDPYDPEQNLAGGAAYLARQLRTFKDVRLALAAYNSGPGRVQALGRVPQIEETERYIARVIDCYLALAAGRQVNSAGQCKPPGAPL